MANVANVVLVPVLVDASATARTLVDCASVFRAPTGLPSTGAPSAPDGPQRWPL